MRFNNIRTIRESQGRTLKDVAKDAKMHHSTLSRFETGAYPIKAKQVLDIATALGVPPPKLFGESQKITVTGVIGAQAVLKPCKHYTIDCLQGFHGPSLYAALIGEDAPYPMRGWFVYYQRENDQPIKDGFCVLTLGNQTMVGTMSKGRKPGTITIKAGSYTLADQILKQCLPVQAIVPPADL